MQKLIFLRNGQRDAEHLYKIPHLEMYYPDGEFQLLGFNEFKKRKLANFKDVKYDVYWVSTIPTILNLYNDNNEPYWWNEKESKWEIYFIEDDKLKDIQEYTDKEIRKAHNIEKMYLVGVFDDE